MSKQIVPASILEQQISLSPHASHCSLTPSPSREGEERGGMVYSWFQSYDSRTTVWERVQYTVQARRITLQVTVIM